MRPLIAIALLLLLTACSSSAVTASEDAALGDPIEPVVSNSDVDVSCKTDADCVVKDVGNCCGYFPACVNSSSPIFPDQVRAACARDGVSSVCGFADISRCECVESQCRAASADAAAVAPADVN